MAAFTIVSDTNTTLSPVRYLFGFLSDFRNFQSVLPSDKVENFQFSGDQCSFNIKGITPMTVKLVEKIPYSSILFSSEGLASFNFKLMVIFIGEAAENGQCRIELSGDLNPFIKSMAEKPLTGLVNTMSQKLAQIEASAPLPA